MSRRRRRPPESSSGHERWLVSYADFITLLFAFFTTLYAISTVDQKKAGKLVQSMMVALHSGYFPDGAAGGPLPVIGGEGEGAGGAVVAAAIVEDPAEAARAVEANAARMRALAARMRALAAEPDLRGKIQVRVEPRGVVVSLAEAGFFESGSSELRAGALQALDKVARHLAAGGEVSAAVEGHTDDRPVKGGRYSNNWELSTARATFVVRFLVERGVDPRRLSAAGYAEFRPVAGNEGADGRARNRRVDMVLQIASGGPAAAPLPKFDQPATE